MSEQLEPYVRKAVAYDGAITSASDDRWRSWVVCHERFERLLRQGSPQADDVRDMALCLGFYLASWGMYRGSTFLLRMGSGVHEDVVRVLLKDEYRSLNEVGFDAYAGGGSRGLELATELSEELRKHYGKAARETARFENNLGRQWSDGHRDKSWSATDTLITKVMLGTMACTPAYDRFFRDGVGVIGADGALNVARVKRFGPESLASLSGLCSQNRECLEGLRLSLGATSGLGDGYPCMKALDFLVWCAGAGLKDA